MLRDIDVIEVLSPSYVLKPVDFDPAVHKFETQTPAHSFTTFLTAVRGGEYLIDIVTRDGCDEHLAQALIQFVRDHQADIDISRPGRVIEGFYHAGYAFDAVWLVSPAAHRRFMSDCPDVHARTFSVAPVYRCEFSGDEDAGLIELLRKEYITTIDWQRPPSPRIWMRYENHRTKTHRSTQRLALAHLSQLHRELKELRDSADSFVEVRNFRGECCKVLAKGRHLLIESPLLANPIRFPADERIIEWMDIFLTSGGIPPLPIATQSLSCSLLSRVQAMLGLNRSV